MDDSEPLAAVRPADAPARAVLRGATRRELAARGLWRDGPATGRALVLALLAHAGGLVGFGALDGRAEPPDAGSGREPPLATTSRAQHVEEPLRPREVLARVPRVALELEPPPPLPEPRVDETPRPAPRALAPDWPEADRDAGRALLARIALRARPATTAPAPTDAAREAPDAPALADAAPPQPAPEPTPPSEPGDASPDAGDLPARPAAGNPPPGYPALARRRGWEGRVLIGVSVDARGEAVSAWVARSCGHDVLDRAALDTVSDWRFVPATRAGVAVAGETEVAVRFSLLDG